MTKENWIVCINILLNNSLMNENNSINPQATILHVKISVDV
jgi:hypothetical protein